MTPDEHFHHVQGVKYHLPTHYVLNESLFLKICFLDVCGCCLVLGWNMCANENSTSAYVLKVQTDCTL